MSKVTLTFCAGKERQLIWVRKDEDYCADFCLLSRRTLTDFEYDAFRFHFLLGADWKLCCRKMNIDRGTFFHTVYRVEQKLGRIFREVEPYSLYPLDEYFGGTLRKSRALLPADNVPADNLVEMPLTFDVEPVLGKTA